MNMLMTEWNCDDAMEVRYQEGWMAGVQRSLMKHRAEALKENYKETMKKILEDIAQAATVKGFYPEIINNVTRFDWFEAGMEKAKNALAKGLSPEEVSTMTGFDLEILKMCLEVR
jgi:DNA-binding ferritin-like protein (Dps family)